MLKFKKSLLQLLIMGLLLLPEYAQGQIIEHVINDTLSGIGTLTKDINQDGTSDFTFEIIDLSPNGLGARVVGLSSSTFIDNSTFGYPDALSLGDSVTGYFNSGNGVLGTFNNAGQFNGMGIKYLGIKIVSGGLNYMGWIKLTCSTANDMIVLISSGYNTSPNIGITAGQTSLTTKIQSNPLILAKEIYPNPTSGTIDISSFNLDNKCTYIIHSLSGEKLINGNATQKINVSSLPNGIYILSIQYEDFTKQQLFQVVK